MRNLKSAAIKFVRKILWRILGPVSPYGKNFVGAQGCIRCAASFLAWNQIEGDYLEFGVFRGESFSEAHRAIWQSRKRVKDFVNTSEIDAWYEQRPRFIAFDSFSGLPGGEAARHADYHEGAYSCSEEDFINNITADGVPRSDILTVPGFYDKTLRPELKQELNLKKASLITIDCDLYESTVPVLEFVTDLVHQGTIIVFDDWYRYKGSPNMGEQRACNEWLQKNPHIELVQYWQQGAQAVAFMVNIRETAAT